MEYPGYGLLSGAEPSEEAVNEVALTVFRFLVDEMHVKSARSAWPNSFREDSSVLARPNHVRKSHDELRKFVTRSKEQAMVVP